MAFRIQLLFALCLLSFYDVNAFILSKQPKERQLVGFSYKDCGPATDPDQILALTVSPDPVQIPGNITVSTKFTITKQNPDDVTVSVVLEKKIAGFYVKIPCVDNVGSCTYSDICKNWAKVCPEFAKYGIPCTCPIPANTYTITDFAAAIKTKIPAIGDGDYRVTANILSPTAGHMFCLYLELTVK